MKSIIIKQNKIKNGFIALMSVLIISALIVVISVDISLLSIDEIGVSLDEEFSVKAMHLATACAEDALFKLKDDFNYLGNETILINSDSCYILATEGTGGTNRIIKTQSTVSGFTKKIKIDIFQLRPLIINSWEEVSVF